MQLQTRGRNHQRRFDFQKALFGKVPTNRSQHPAPLHQQCATSITVEAKVVATRRRKRLPGTLRTSQQHRCHRDVVRRGVLGRRHDQLNEVGGTQRRHRTAHRETPQLLAVIDPQELGRNLDQTSGDPFRHAVAPSSPGCCETFSRERVRCSCLHACRCEAGHPR